MSRTLYPREANFDIEYNMHGTVRFANLVEKLDHRKQQGEANNCQIGEIVDNGTCSVTVSMANSPIWLFHRSNDWRGGLKPIDIPFRPEGGTVILGTNLS